jgi:hypothetical protein
MNAVMSGTYLTAEQFTTRIHYYPRAIRTRLKDSVLLGGAQYIRQFGGRKLLFILEAIQRDIGLTSANPAMGIPITNCGGVHG